jgi:deoxynucleoside triphosphate triphosphohydrolase SAMHD1
MTDMAWREIAFVAARTTLYKRRSRLAEIALIPYPTSPEITVACSSSILLEADAVVHRVGLDPEQLRLVMTAADRSGYFAGQYRLASFDSSEEEIQSAAVHLNEFNGQGNWVVRYQSVRAFLEQFPPRLRPRILHLIRNFKILDRVELASAISQVIRELPRPADGHQGFIVGLSPDSGNTARVKLEHDLRDSLAELGWSFKKTIRDVLEQADPGDDIVFCDDNVTSGSQAACQFMAWLGVPDEQWNEEQRQEQGIERASLSKHDQARLKDLRVTIVSAVGTAAGRENLRSTLPSLGLNLFQGLFYGRDTTEERADLGEAQDFLSEVGREVLAWSRHRRDYGSLTREQSAACQRDSLGYRGATCLMCTPMNVPVGTVTAFWCPGIFQGEPWIPLVIRRGYLKHLVLA